MLKKPLGICPHCQCNVRAKVVENKTITRDICICPECSEKVLRCRSPGCNNYTEYDDFFNELCPKCSKEFPERVLNLAKGAAGTMAAAVGVFLAWDKYNNK